MPSPDMSTSLESVFCEECGEALGASARFCKHCGASQPVADEPWESAPLEPATPASTTPEPVSPAPAAPAPESALPRSSGTVATGYTICAIREIADGPTEIDEALLYPVGLIERDSVAVEKRDGSDIKRLKCTAIQVTAVGAKKPLLQTKDISAGVMLTDARVTVACTKYDKGGGWRGWGIGGVALAVPLNVASHALAARRRRGKMLVGQVRFPWVDGVYAQSRVGFGGSERLRVVANTGGKNRLRVDLTFPRDVDACAVARELIRRAAAFRLAHDDQDFGDQERARLIELSQVGRLVYEKGTGKMVGHQFPSSWPVSDRSARFGAA